MKKFRNPFKFLDAYTYQDHEVFFGRQKEVALLYQMVHQTPLLLLYGLSGTGKTSLIQCGLANMFNGPDWLPIFVRRKHDINESLADELGKVLPKELEHQSAITSKILSVYNHYLRPVYLIFDQFEELFTSGTSAEQDQFIAALHEVLDAKLPCTIIISLREEYLGQLYSFEEEIPSLFDFRLRVEPMTISAVEEVIKNSFDKFNIHLETLDLKETIRNNISISKKRAEFELPYLQVYLYNLYNEDYERTYPEGTVLSEDSWPRLEFTRQEIEEFGNIQQVLEVFLNTEKGKLQQKQDSLAVEWFINALVTDEGTKRPIRIERTAAGLRIAEQQRDLFGELPESVITFCAEELAKARLINITDESMELAHDILADLISQNSRELREIKSMIKWVREEHTRAQLRGEPYFLSLRQIERITNYSQFLPDHQVFIEQSKEHHQAIAQAQQRKLEEEQRRLEQELHKEKEDKARIRKSNFLLMVLVAFCVVSMIISYQACSRAEASERIATESLKEANKNARALEQKEIKEIIKLARDLIKRSDSLKDCCISASLELLKKARSIIDGGIKEYGLDSTDQEIRKIKSNIDQKEKFLNSKNSTQ